MERGRKRKKMGKREKGKREKEKKKCLLETRIRRGQRGRLWIIRSTTTILKPVDCLYRKTRLRVYRSRPWITSRYFDSRLLFSSANLWNLLLVAFVSLSHSFTFVADDSSPSRIVLRKRNHKGIWQIRRSKQQTTAKNNHRNRHCNASTWINVIFFHDIAGDAGKIWRS